MSADVHQIALEAALRIEDAFCRSWVGGRSQRLAYIQVVVAAAIGAGQSGKPMDDSSKLKPFERRLGGIG